MHPALAGDPLFVARFHREAKSAAQLSTPYAVAVTDQGTDRSPAGDRVFLVMELVRGPTLRRRLTEQGPLPVAEAARHPGVGAAGARRGAPRRHGPPRRQTGERVARAAAGWRRPGMGDLWPTARTPRWQVKVADFGLARAVESSPLTAADRAAARDRGLPCARTGHQRRRGCPRRRLRRRHPALRDAHGAAPARRRHPARRCLPARQRRRPGAEPAAARTSLPRSTPWSSRRPRETRGAGRRTRRLCWTCSVGPGRGCCSR